MKICQLCNLDSTMFHFLLPLMRGMRAAGHEVTGVCAPGPYIEKVEAEGFNVIPVAIERSFNLPKHVASARELRSVFEREQFDIVHVHNPVAALVGRYAAWRAGVPRIAYTAHGFYFHDQMALPKRSVFIALEWLAGQVTDVLFTQAEEDAQTARRLRLGKGHISAIGNGVDTQVFHDRADMAARKRIRAETGTPDERIVAMSIGRLVSEKGFPELIDAMREVDAELWIVGERLKSDHAGGIDDALISIESDPVLKKRVRLLGYRADIAELLRAADMFVLASHREGMPRSIIEAMMCGLPVVSTNIRGSREEVIDNETGLLVPVKDPELLSHAINALATNETKRQAFGAAGRRRALELYDEQKVIERQLEALDL